MSYNIVSAYRHFRAFGLSPLSAFAFAKLSRRAYKPVSINSLISSHS